MTQRRSARRPPAKPRVRAKTRAGQKNRAKPPRSPVVEAPETRLVSDASASCFPGVAHPKKRAYLAAFVQTGNRVRASQSAGISRRTAFNWEHDETDTAFRAAFAVATQLASDLLEAEATRRAFEGVSRPIYQGGRLVGYEQQYSDTLLIFLLKGAKPEVYRERIDTKSSSVDAFIKFLEDVASPVSAPEVPHAPSR